MRSLIKMLVLGLFALGFLYGQEQNEAEKAWQEFLKAYKEGPAERFAQSMDKVVSFGDLVVPLICPMVQNREVFPFFKSFLIYMLSRIKTEKAVECLLKVIEDTIPIGKIYEEAGWKGDWQEWNRNRAIDALGEIGDTSVTMFLIKYLFRENESEVNKGYICSVLGQIGDTRATPYINKALQQAIDEWNNKKQETLIGMALRALMKIGDKKSVFIVLEILRKDDILKYQGPLPYMVLEKKGHLAKDTVLKSMIELCKRKEGIVDDVFVLGVFWQLGSEGSISMIKKVLKENRTINRIEKQNLQQLISNISDPKRKEHWEKIKSVIKKYEQGGKK